jgi:hypothetical protein
MELESEKRLAGNLFNQAWDLLDKPERSPSEDLLMISRAHASLYHWIQVGTAVNEARGYWQVSRVYATLKWPQPALIHAERSLAICLEHDIGDFDLAFGYEAVARALFLDGRKSEGEKYFELGLQSARKISNPEEREHFMKELNSILK